MRFFKMKDIFSGISMYGLEIGKRSWMVSVLYKEEGRWCYKTRFTRTSFTSTTTRCINPLPKWEKKSLCWLIRFMLKLMKEEYKICQGCGMDEAVWKIRDPNYGSGNKYYNCCDGCVRFYDQRMSRMKIVNWKKGKEVAVRKWD